VIEVGTFEQFEMQYTVEKDGAYSDGRGATWRVRRDGMVIGVVYAMAARDRFEAIEMPDRELIGWYDTVAAACEGLVDYFELMAGEIEL